MRDTYTVTYGTQGHYAAHVLVLAPPALTCATCRGALDATYYGVCGLPEVYCSAACLPQAVTT